MKPRDEFYRNDDLMGEEALVVARVIKYPIGEVATVLVRGVDGKMVGAKQIAVTELEGELDPFMGTLTAEPAAEQKAYRGKLTAAMEAYF